VIAAAETLPRDDAGRRAGSQLELLDGRSTIPVLALASNDWVAL